MVGLRVSAPLLLLAACWASPSWALSDKLVQGHMEELFAAANNSPGQQEWQPSETLAKLQQVAAELKQCAACEDDDDYSLELPSRLQGLIEAANVHDRKCHGLYFGQLNSQLAQFEKNSLHVVPFLRDCRKRLFAACHETLERDLRERLSDLSPVELVTVQGFATALGPHPPAEQLNKAFEELMKSHLAGTTPTKQSVARKLNQLISDPCKRLQMRITSYMFMLEADFEAQTDSELRNLLTTASVCSQLERRQQSLIDLAVAKLAKL